MAVEITTLVRFIAEILGKRVIERAAQKGLEVLRGETQQRKFKKALERAATRLFSGYEQLERVEGRALYLQESFFEDQVVRRELSKLLSPEEIDHKAIQERFVALYGRENLDMFWRNFRDFVNALKAELTSELDPGEMFMFSEVLNRLSILTSVEQRLDQIQELIEESQVVAREPKPSTLAEIPAKEAPHGAIASLSSEIAEAAELQRAAGSHVIIEDGRALFSRIEAQARKLEKYRSRHEKRIWATVERAKKVLREHDIHAGLEQLRLAQRRVDESPEGEELEASLLFELWRLTGACLVRLGELDEARLYLDRARDLDPEDEKLLVNCAEYHLQRRDFAKARLGAEKALVTNDESMEAKNILAILEIEQEHPEGAISLLRGKEAAGDNATSLWLLSTAHLLKGDFDTALEYAKTLERRDPSSPAAPEALANVYLSKAYGDMSSRLLTDRTPYLVDFELLSVARDCYREAVRRYEDLRLEHLAVTTLANLTRALMDLGEVEEAISILEKALILLPGNLQLLMMRADLTAVSGEVGKARELCAEILERESQDYRPLVLLAVICLGDDRPDEAISYLENADKLCEQEPDCTNLKLLLSKAHQMANQEQESLERLNGINDTMRDQAAIYLAYGEHFIHFAHRDEAEKQLSLAYQKDSQNPSVLAALGNFYVFVARRAAKGIPYYKKLARLFPTPMSYRALAQAHFLAQDFSGALEVLVEAASRDIVSPSLTKLRAASLANLRKDDEAIEIYSAYREEHADDFESTYNLGLCLWRKGRRARAIDLLEAARELRPRERLVWVQLPQLYLLEGDKERAFQTAKEAAETFSDDPEVRLRFVVVAFSAGREHEAVKALMRIPQEFPDFPGLRIATVDELVELEKKRIKLGQELGVIYDRGDIPMQVFAHLLGMSPATLSQVIRARGSRLLVGDGRPEEQTREAQAVADAVEVVIGYTGLLTLQMLGLFSKAEESFDRIYVPADIYEQLQDDKLRLEMVKQKNRLGLQEDLKAYLLSTAEIVKVKEPVIAPEEVDEERFRDVPPLDVQDIALAEREAAFYVLDNPLHLEAARRAFPDRTISTSVLLEALKQRGAITLIQFDKLVEDLKKRGSYCEPKPPPKLDAVRGLVLDYLTVEMLFELELLPIMIDQFGPILVSIATLVSLEEGITREKFKVRTADIIDEIDAAIQGSKVFLVEAATADEILEQFAKYEEQPLKQVAGAFALALEKGVPLWSDELAIKRLAKGEHPTLRYFGTSAFLAAAASRNVVSEQEYFRNHIALVKSNYFFVPLNFAHIYWSIEQHSFNLNDESILLIENCADALSRVASDFEAPFLTGRGFPDAALIQHVSGVLVANLTVFADLTSALWVHIDQQNRNLSCRWGEVILERIWESIHRSRFLMAVFLATSVLRLMRAEPGLASQFLWFAQFWLWCKSAEPKVSSQGLRPELVYEAVAHALSLIYGDGDLDEVRVNLAKQLMGSLRGNLRLSAIGLLRDKMPDLFEQVH